MKALENDYRLIRRSAYLIIGSNVLSCAVVWFLFWMSYSGFIPAGPVLMPILPIYLGLLAAWSVVHTLVLAILMLKNIAECNEINKKRKSAEEWLVRMIQVPFFGLCVSCMGKKNGDSIALETLRFRIAISARNGKIDWSEALKNRPVCEFPSVKVTALSNNEGQVRVFLHDGITFFVVLTLPKQLTQLLDVYDCTVFGKERARQW